MFDPISVEILKSAPELDGIEIDRLPEFLSEIYTKIINLRSKMTIDEFQIDEKDSNELQELWRLAHTYSTLTTGGKLDKQQKLGAAFVAGNAFNLIWQANNIGLTSYKSLDQFSDTSISPVILSAILFMIAEQPADAYEASDKIKLKINSLSSIDILEQAIYHLIRGNLKSILELPKSNTVITNYNDSPDLELLAYQILWDKIIYAIRKLVNELLDTSNNESKSWRSYFIDIIKLSLSKEMIMDYNFKSSFATPFHLASLLLEMGNELYQKSVTKIPTPPNIDSNLWKDYLKFRSNTRPYLWKNHFDSIQKGFLSPGISSVITFPTGAGKSTITELKIVSTLLSGRSVIFLVPTKALVDQVERELKKNLKQYFSEDSIINQLYDTEVEDFSIENFINGSVIEDSYYIDFQENLPSISVMTPERSLSIMSVEKELFSNLGLIVFDECHLLHGDEHDINRRAIDAMFALLNLIFIPKHKPDVLLTSAMIKNGDELAGWLSEILESKCLSLDIRWKPTRQARGCVIYNNDEILKLRDLIAESLKNTDCKGPPTSLKKMLTVKPVGLFCLKQTWNTVSLKDYIKIDLLNNNVLLSATGRRPDWYLTANRNKVAAMLGQFFASMGIKTLIFAETPKNSNSIAIEAAKIIDDSYKIKLHDDDQKLLDICIAEVGDINNVYHLYDQKTACHHGLLLLSERRLIENVFKRTEGNGINILSATPTLAQGMNLPVELVILAGDDRFDLNDGDRKLLNAHELLNASGRAGRAGWIATGLVILIPSKIISINESEEETTLNSHWFELKELIYSQEDQCLRLNDPITLCLDVIQSEVENNKKEIEYFLQRLPIENEEEIFKIFKKTFGYHIAKQNNNEEIYISKIQFLKYKLQTSTKNEFETWLEALATETGIPIEIISNIQNSIIDIDITINCFEWIDFISNWIIKHEEFGSKIIPIDALKELYWVKEERNSIPYNKVIFKMISSIKLWIAGNTLTDMSNSFLNSNEKCKIARKFIVRLLPNISFIFGLFPLVYRKMNENNESDIEIPATFGSIAGCIREGFDCPEKLAMYHIKIKEKLTSRVLIHHEFNELGIEKKIDSTRQTYDELSKNIWELLNIK